MARCDQGRRNDWWKRRGHWCRSGLGVARKRESRVQLGQTLLIAVVWWKMGMLQLWAGVMLESSESASWREKEERRRGRRSERDGFKYLGGHWARVSDTAVIVYFAPAFTVNLLPACCSSRLATVTLSRSGPSSREGVFLHQ